MHLKPLAPDMHPSYCTNPVTLMAAPNGARRTKADHPALPMTVEEIAAEARLCRDAGAAAIHVHVRDADGRHSLDPGLYREAIAAIRQAAGADFFVQITTEAADIFDRDAQKAALRGCAPDGISIALREFTAPGEDGAEFAELLRETLARGIAVQVILYSAAERVALRRVADDTGLDTARLSCLYVLGRYTANQTAEPRDLFPFLAAQEQDTGAPFRGWMVCAFGVREHACAIAAALLGGHVRVGFENNFALANGERAAGTHALVAETRGRLGALGLRSATPAEVRALFGVPAN